MLVESNICILPIAETLENVYELKCCGTWFVGRRIYTNAIIFARLNTAQPESFNISMEIYNILF